MNDDEITGHESIDATYELYARSDPYTHRPDPCVDGECALCTQDATHKVAEDNSDNTGLFRRHPFTNYVCCDCFGRLMGPMAQNWCKS